METVRFLKKVRFPKKPDIKEKMSPFGAGIGLNIRVSHTGFSIYSRRTR
jgi:hypothetical protein